MDRRNRSTKGQGYFCQWRFEAGLRLKSSLGILGPVFFAILLKIMLLHFPPKSTHNPWDSWPEVGHCIPSWCFWQLLFITPAVGKGPEGASEIVYEHLYHFLKMVITLSWQEEWGLCLSLQGHSLPGWGILGIKAGGELSLREFSCPMTLIGSYRCTWREDYNMVRRTWILELSRPGFES